MSGMLHAHGAHSYPQKLVQALMLGNNAQRLDYSNLKLSTLEENLSFLCEILWIDESTLTRDGKRAQCALLVF